MTEINVQAQAQEIGAHNQRVLDEMNRKVEAQAVLMQDVAAGLEAKLEESIGKAAVVQKHFSADALVNLADELGKAKTVSDARAAFSKASESSLKEMKDLKGTVRPVITVERRTLIAASILEAVLVAGATYGATRLYDKRKASKAAAEAEASLPDDMTV